MRSAEEILSAIPEQGDCQSYHDWLIALVESVQADARSEIDAIQGDFLRKAEDYGKLASMRIKDINERNIIIEALLTEKEKLTEERNDAMSESAHHKRCAQSYLKELFELKAKEESFGNEFTAVTILKGQLKNLGLSRTEYFLEESDRLRAIINELQKERDEILEAVSNALNPNMGTVVTFQKLHEVLARYKSHGTEGRDK